ncbi:MAG: hypothetical protein J0M25_13040 [Flavobacteriales bacterium]|nr:hypothetical protein [Flavobacteriales bacterium]
MINSVNCYGYVKGVTDGLYVGMETANGVKKFCLPENGLNDNAMYKMIRDFITSKNMPDDMPIRSVILATYANYFPCER